MTAREWNFDGLIGPTHNYAGLSLGNVASATNAGGMSSPRQAALQGLAKMEAMLALGLPQGLLPPHPRPNLHWLHALGFRGSPEAMAADCWRADTRLFANVMSASPMWTANAGTVSPSSDCADGRLHVSAANLASMLHRAGEHPFTTRLLRALFADVTRFAVHDALPGGQHFGDEGAANHMRLATAHGEPGVEVFVHGGESDGRFPARQRRRAGEAVARRHGLDPAATLFVEQSRRAIQAGAFHNDVVAVANEAVLFAHEAAFEEGEAAADAMRAAFPALEAVIVPEAEVSLDDAIRSYLFNSQLITLPEGGMALILPGECERTPSVKAYVDRLIAGNGPVRQAHYFDLRESMRNGGGPACLRLRVVLTAEEEAAIDPRFTLDAAKIGALKVAVARTYPESIAPERLGDPALHRQCCEALDAVADALSLSDLYP